MNDRLRLLLLLLLATVFCSAQHNTPVDFIPKGYVEFARYFGDLNKDGEEDCVLLIKGTDTSDIVLNRFDTEVDRNRRGIIVLFKERMGYRLVDKNYDCFSSENEDGGVYYPPELGIEIRNEKLYIRYAHGRYGHWEYCFRYQRSNFELIGYESSSNRGPITERETSINFLTKKRLTRVNTNESAQGGNETFEERWSDIQLDAAIRLSEIEDFDELDVSRY